MIWKALISWFGGNPAKEEATLLPSEAFRRQMARERLRADRGHKPLSMVTMSLAGMQQPESARRHIGELCRQRLRITDDAGLLSDELIGILLPETPGSGAWKVADDLRQLLSEVEQPREIRVYTYTSYRQGGPDSAHPSTTPDGRPIEPLEMFFVVALPVWKRALDILGALAGLLLLSPILALTAALVALTSPGPIFFSQRRQTAGGREFAMLKFRTMYIDAEERKAELMRANEQDGPAFKMENDPRVTPIGNFLRRSAIDELPQLWNVLMGDMTLVGPRPLEHKEQRHAADWQRRRLDVTPGLTCIWQVDGGTHVSFADWMRMDLRYIASHHPLFDLVLIGRTALKLVLRAARL